MLREKTQSRPPTPLETGVQRIIGGPPVVLPIKQCFPTTPALNAQRATQILPTGGPPMIQRSIHRHPA